MLISSHLSLSRLSFFVVCAAAILIAFCPSIWAQVPPPLPPESVLVLEPDAIVERLRALEEKNFELTERLEQTNRELEAQSQLLERTFSGDARFEDGQLPFQNAISTGDQSSPVPDYTEGMFDPFTPAPGYPNSNVPSVDNYGVDVRFGPGFQLKTRDKQFSLNIHYESQIEARVWQPNRNDPSNDGFFLPRQRIFFNGNITKNLEYELAINRGVNNINLLNAYLNFHFSDALEVRIGRFFTPFNYDQYAVSNYWLLTPERSLFTTNLSLNRQIGAMAWGYLLDKKLDYAVGAFNGSRNSFESLNNGVDLVAYLNLRPFQESEMFPRIKFLNIGTSVAYGNQGQAPVPTTFRIGAGSPDSNTPSTATTPFLVLNPGVSEQGERLLGTVHMAYFYNSLSLISEWQYGHGGYALGANPSVEVPFSGYYVSGGYFLTGEKIERRTRVKPLRPFLPLKKDERKGPGAWEAVARVSQLRVGREIFDAGLADPTQWSNSATTTELGLNWYWNDYLKFYTFWLHGEFGDPVQFSQGEYHQSVDMCWMRCQLYF
ncbi:OprO/OprP family phosphate-selective porin [Planctomicrobium sp. SH527]|uniref:OprO/OprP family phosphate-selective porin n=1 Tax=Planctomicrobium sp. SH527 TaxID=3448123 RepID=UPI003F5BD480